MTAGDENRPRKEKDQTLNKKKVVKLHLIASLDRVTELKITFYHTEELSVLSTTFRVTELATIEDFCCS